jgi:nucleoside-diphosphate-sugar epimerase
MKIGFVGLGIMGSRMAANLQKRGHSLVVFNRTREKADPLVAEVRDGLTRSPLWRHRWRLSSRCLRIPAPLKKRSWAKTDFFRIYGRVKCGLTADR